MASSSKASTRRVERPTIHAPSPHPKPTISLEEWEAKAPLTDKELRSIALIQKARQSKPLPLKGAEEDGHSTPRSATPIPHIKGRIALQAHSRPGTPKQSAEQRPNPSSSHPLLPSAPLQTPQQFYDWLASIENSVAHSQEAHYRTHLSNVSDRLSTCDSLVGQVDEMQTDLNGMLDDWRTVEMGGKSLQDASDELLNERDRLIRLSEEIGARLEYFQELEHATRMLNHPGDSLVMQADFLDMVERVDICIDFLNNNRHYQEAEIYLLRFRQCLTRAMTLIKMYFVGSLKALMTDITRRMSGKGMSNTAVLHLLYTRFQSVSSQLSPLLGELERRTHSHPNELTSLLAECHTAYFSARRTLLIGQITEEIKGLDPGSADLVELTRSGCTYLKQLCIDEFAIYRCFFDSGKGQLYQYLEGLCDYLYDDLRPRILHEGRLSVLCDVCKVLQALMVLDVPDIDPSSEDEDEFDLARRSTGKNGTTQGVGRLHVGHMLQSILQDAQTRLFFKAQNVIQSDIRYYAPKPEDLDYPKILSVAHKPGPYDIQEVEDDTPFKLTSFDKRVPWYPPLRSTVSILAQLREFIQPAIFDDIAQESLDLCRISILMASSLVTARELPSTEVDGQLFLVRHLLILKELTTSLNLIEKGANGPIEFHHVTDTLKDMLRTTSFLQYSFASASKGREDANAFDTKERIDDDLRLACEHVIAICSLLAVRPIQLFMSSVTGNPSPLDSKGRLPAIDSANGGPSNKASSSSAQALSSLSRDAAVDADIDFRTKFLPVELPALVARLRLYLGASSIASNSVNSTVDVLLSHILDKTVDEYVSFRKATEFMSVADEGKRFEMTVEEFRTFIKSIC